jgi:hypothetical protein
VIVSVRKEDMNSFVKSSLPTIYADMNLYRYIAYGDISIEKPDRFLWVYSYVHLDEVHRNGNMDALEGMRSLGAVEISDILNARFQSVGNIVVKKYIDPYERYQQHLEAISGYEGHSDVAVEHLIRSFGADNFKELSNTPEQLCEEIDRLTSIVDDESREHLLKKAKEVSLEMKKSIDTHLKVRRPIDQTRRAMGLTSEDRKNAEMSHSPIDEIWKIMAPSVKGVTKNQFFGFEPIPGIEGLQYTQHGSIASAHIILNMLGISPDKGLTKRDKIKTVMSDGQHVGMASYCNALLSADKRFCDKARAIYTYIGNITNALHFNYQKGFVLNLGIKEA